MEALLALEDGRIFKCRSFTGNGETSGEVVFNTGMTGYQEVLTDPSYKGQIVTMTYPLVGNYGINSDDVESCGIQVAGFVVKEYQNYPSNFRSKETLAQYLKKHRIMGVDQLDTRALTLHIRNSGAMRAMLSTYDLNQASLVKRAANIESMVGRDLAKEVTCKQPFHWINGQPRIIDKKLPLDKNSWIRKEKDKKRVVVFDFGIKYNILRCLEEEECEIIVVPGQTSEKVVKELSPDGIFLSNGPGDPEPVKYAIETIRSLIGFRPIFGICLGHQLLGLALGGKTYKLKFGHRGVNQPVKNLQSGKIEITSQNHGFAVDHNSFIDKGIEITHINLNDNTLEGFRHNKNLIMAAQYHPEASPGPHDARYLFNEFNKMMNK